jgi:hypothetical protein
MHKATYVSSDGNLTLYYKHQNAPFSIFLNLRSLIVSLDSYKIVSQSLFVWMSD